jgi:two-component system, chemotaxis family, response regulator Rcp1
LKTAAKNEAEKMCSHKSGTPAEILLIEDNPGDVRLLGEALRESGVPHYLHVTGDGAQALAFLRHAQPFSHAPRPDLIILDLCLPGKSGHDVLAECKSDRALQEIPIIIMTTSDAPTDILQAYRLHANSYITKPVDLERFFEVVRALGKFWFATAQLPTRTHP